MTKAKLLEINSQDEIPVFKNDEEAAEFWSTHSMGPGLIDTSDAPPLTFTRSRFRPATEQTNLKLETDTKERLKRLAKLKGMPYQTLLKAFVLERLYEEEKRMGLVGK